VAARDPDPRDVARFQRGWTGDPALPSPDEPTARAGREPDEQPEEEARWSGGAAAVAAGAFALLAAGALAWGCLDPAFTAPPRPDPLAAVRVVAAAAPAPLAVAVVVATALAVRGTTQRIALRVAAALAVGAVSAVAATAIGIARLASLTAQGPVSSGGIPLPDTAMAVYAQRVQAIGMLTTATPGILLAAALALLLVVALLSRPLAAPADA
jgi:hypothetical protein